MPEDKYLGPNHLDNQPCWCGDDHTWLDLSPAFSHSN